MGFLAGSLLLIIASACALNICDHETLEHRNIIPKEYKIIEFQDQRCEPGTTFRNYCNECKCYRDCAGTYAHCTTNVCIAGIWNKDGFLNIHDLNAPTWIKKKYNFEGKCQPGKWFKKDCRICICGTSGLVSRAACTKVLCNGRCISGTSYKKYCNDCKCRFDCRARLVEGSDNFCDRKIWTIDGTGLKRG